MLHLVGFAGGCVLVALALLASALLAATPQEAAAAFGFTGLLVSCAAAAFLRLLHRRPAALGGRRG